MRMNEVDALDACDQIEMFEGWRGATIRDVQALLAIVHRLKDKVHYLESRINRLEGHDGW